MAADMGYMHRPVELLSDPRKLQKSAKSVVSLGVSYYPGDHPENDSGGGGGIGAGGGAQAHGRFLERLLVERGGLAEGVGGGCQASRVDAGAGGAVRAAAHSDGERLTLR